ncbi:MAG: hypothetical protein JWO36_2527 [Myxococcales bacterium]|nr:hypothetical protein [Myxococcales bacterium]
MAVSASAAPDKQLLVVSSPGSPGSTDEAQPRMDAFAAALSAKAGIPIAAVYDPSDSGGAKRFAKAGLGIVSLPFFLEHEQALGLHARLDAVQKGRPPLERWALVAQKGRIKGADGLAGFTIVSNAAFAPAFVRGSVLGDYGALPANVKLSQSGAVLSSLRRAAAGEPIAVLLDGSQAASLASLPFASKLEVVTRSPPMPADLVVTIDSRMPARDWSAIDRALQALPSDPGGAATLEAIQLDRFVPLDDKALAAARRAYAKVP